MTRSATVYARKVRGFRDIDADLNSRRWRIVNAATTVYERHGFAFWDTPLLEYAACIGKHLPDEQTTVSGVYAFSNPEIEPRVDAEGREVRDAENRVVMEHHPVALRYDLTAPLARLYAERFRDRLVREQGAAPLFRRYQFGPVFRFEAKLDPGRYREFWQIDFDTVGSADVACDAEVCRVLYEALVACGLPEGSFEIRVGHRGLHGGLFEKLELSGGPEMEQGILRVVDKVEKIGLENACAELGPGREDAVSGAFIPGLGLDAEAVKRIAEYLNAAEGMGGRPEVLKAVAARVGGSPSGDRALAELETMHTLLSETGYGEDRVVFDPSIARGLAYYTGPVFEAVSRLAYRDDQGNERRFGAVCGGGRYDGLVESLLGVKVPATGAAIGVDRLAELLGRIDESGDASGPVIVIAMDPSLMVAYERMGAELREAGVACEVYYGDKKRMKAQMAYADSRRAPVVVIAGEDEIRKGTVSLKDLRVGKSRSASISDRSQWREAKPGQIEVPRGDLVRAVRDLVASGAGK